MSKIYKKEEDKYSCLFTLSLNKHDYNYIIDLSKKYNLSIRKIIRNIINKHYVEINKE